MMRLPRSRAAPRAKICSRRMRAAASAFRHFVCFLLTPRCPLFTRYTHHTALKDPSSLFRHDVAFCMGQRQDPAAVEVLQAILRDGGEHAM
jgi:hypothetical protein